MRNFSIVIGPYNGQYWKCGSTTNDIATGETVSFTCDANAIAAALTITVKHRSESLMLCKVLVFGAGML